MPRAAAVNDCEIHAEMFHPQMTPENRKFGSTGSEGGFSRRIAWCCRNRDILT